ncbi:MAG: T9SS type A sorting domain-containing protein [Saprospiraceae bacterium]
MKIQQIKLPKITLLILGILLSNSLFANSHIKIQLDNIAVTAKSLEFDIYILNDGEYPTSISACSYGLNINNTLLNGGNIQCTYIQGSRSQELNPFGEYSIGIKKLDEISHLQFTNYPSSYNLSPLMDRNTKFKLGRFRIENTESWKPSKTKLVQFQTDKYLGRTNNQVIAYVDTDGTMTTFNAAKKNLSSGIEEGSLINSINEIKSIGIQSLFPNPASNSIILEINSPTEETARISINTLQGQSIQQFDIELSKGANKINVDLKYFAPGTYFIQSIILDKISQNKFTIL